MLYANLNKKFIDKLNKLRKSIMFYSLTMDDVTDAVKCRYCGKLAKGYIVSNHSNTCPVVLIDDLFDYLGVEKHVWKPVDPHVSKEKIDK
jgi:hypothetical protein